MPQRERNRGLSDQIRAITGKTQPHLCAKFRCPAGAGKHAAKIAAVIVRELAGFIQDIAGYTPADSLKAGLGV